MEIYLLRHAIAVERGTPGIKRDRDRPLTAEGIRKMRRIARGMRALKLTFGAIWTSPYVRARHTAEIAADALELREKLELVDELAADVHPRRIVARLRELPAASAPVLLVGHEPFLSELAGAWLGGADHPPRLALKKGGLCKLVVVGQLAYARCAELGWLLTPRQLALMA